MDLSGRCHGKEKAEAVRPQAPRRGHSPLWRALALTRSRVSLNDAWLVERARHGDHAAFAVLVRALRTQTQSIRVSPAWFTIPNWLEIWLRKLSGGFIVRLELSIPREGLSVPGFFEWL